MSISIVGLSKVYGTQKAVNNISFQAKQGEVVGFLGPNGAGKSTTMKMITGYLPSSAGTIEVCGQIVQANNLAIRKQIGYLPENNPLYLDMYVQEYLKFVANIYGIKNAKKRIAELIDLTGLGVEQHKKIHQLSKGYRQRVGLAQAMINDPKVLILDEPTSGLDPNQLADIRQLIIDLGKNKTVLLSTHIMQEVQAVCERVIIINKGQIVANNTTQNLTQSAGNNSLYVVEFMNEVDSEVLSNYLGVSSIEKQGKLFKIESHLPQDLRPQLFEFAVKNKNCLLTLQREQSNLEAVFRDLTR